MKKQNWINKLKEFEQQNSKLRYVAFICNTTKLSLYNSKQIADEYFKVSADPYIHLDKEQKLNIRKYKNI